VWCSAVFLDKTEQNMTILDEYGNEIENGDLIELHFSVKNEHKSYVINGIYKVVYHKFYGVCFETVTLLERSKTWLYGCLDSDFFELLRNTDNVLKIENGCFDMYNTITGLSKVKKVTIKSKTEQ
jgi:hypothetical protein